jgi:hypothetical protein
LIGTSREEGVAMGRKGKSMNVRLVPVELKQCPSRRDFPQAKGAIAKAGGQGTTIRREADTVDTARRSIERESAEHGPELSRFAACGAIPQSHGIVVSARRYPFAVRRESDRKDGMLMAQPSRSKASECPRWKRIAIGIKA